MSCTLCREETRHHVAQWSSRKHFVAGAKNILIAGGLAIRKRGRTGRPLGAGEMDFFLLVVGCMELAPCTNHREPQQVDSRLTGTSLREGAISFPTESPVPQPRRWHSVSVSGVVLCGCVVIHQVAVPYDLSVSVTAYFCVICVSVDHHHYCKQRCTEFTSSCF